ncbi:hypothetical protein [Clostridium rectalis]|uniref:hypothetical protein n=1 Tax=Clostridium rectalis TaxID=2040295 RepID=UPI000F63CC6F|nr:hypothetical protein [Clostridium rectalis]
MRGFYFKMLRINIKNISYYILIILASLIFSIKNRQYLINFALLIIVWVESNNKLFKLSISFGSSRKK